MVHWTFVERQPDFIVSHFSTQLHILSMEFSKVFIHCDGSIVPKRSSHHDLKVLHPLYKHQFCWGDCMPCKSGRLHDEYDLLWQSSLEEGYQFQLHHQCSFQISVHQMFLLLFFILLLHTRKQDIFSAQDMSCSVKMHSSPKLNKYFTGLFVMAACLLPTLLIQSSPDSIYMCLYYCLC